MNNRIVDSWLENRADFPGWSALKWLEFVMTDEHDAVAQSWTTDEVKEATDLFMHPVFGGDGCGVVCGLWRVVAVGGDAVLCK